MNAVLDMLKALPAYLSGAFKEHLIILIIGLVIFLVALIFTNALARFCRYVFVIGSIILGVYGFLTKKTQLVFTIIVFLILMIVIRVIMYTIRTIRQNRINRRIEERALAKAAARRGSWKNRQGYSGEAKPIESDYVPGKMNAQEINDVIKNDMSDTVHAAKAKQATAKLPTPEELENARAILAAADKAKAKAAAAPAPKAAPAAENGAPAKAAAPVAETAAPATKKPAPADINIDNDPNPGRVASDPNATKKEKLTELIHKTLGSDYDDDDFFDDHNNDHDEI
ncbi:MAG: hypothetical protein Q4B73_06425 [Lachnospiraceae bacterium]|nr:hypothetical protein [Lachnospiraceae bacterium]